MKVVDASAYEMDGHIPYKGDVVHYIYQTNLDEPECPPCNANCDQGRTCPARQKRTVSEWDDVFALAWGLAPVAVTVIVIYIAARI